jgi:hypothetical protein
MKVDPANLAAQLVKTDIVEPLEARPVDRPHAVIRDEEVLLPAHKDVLAVGHVFDHDVAAAALLHLLLEGPEGLELGPVRQVCLVAGAPRRVLRVESVLCPDYLALEVRR